MADNVLGTLFGDIANAIRTKTGDTAKMKPSEFPTKILEIEVVGGATETDIIPEQEFALTLNSQLGVYMASGFDLFSLKSGEKYYVVWGEETFTCTAVDGTYEGAPCVAIGNPYPVGGTNNNLPFVIGCVPNLEGHTLCVIVALAEQTETKKVRVYQKASGGDTPFGKYVEIFPEQTITAKYIDLYQQYAAEISLDRSQLEMNPNHSGDYFGTGTIFFVWFDDVLYPCGLTTVRVKMSSAASQFQDVNYNMLGNPGVLDNKLYGYEITLVSTNYFTEPFCGVMGTQGFTMGYLYLNDGNPHTLKIGCIQRNITKIES